MLCYAFVYSNLSSGIPSKHSNMLSLSPSFHPLYSVQILDSERREYSSNVEYDIFSLFKRLALVLDGLRRQ